jgi:hypothetical protein
MIADDNDELHVYIKPPPPPKRGKKEGSKFRAFFFFFAMGQMHPQTLILLPTFRTRSLETKLQLGAGGLRRRRPLADHLPQPPLLPLPLPCGLATASLLPSTPFVGIRPFFRTEPTHSVPPALNRGWHDGSRPNQCPLRPRKRVSSKNVTGGVGRILASQSPQNKKPANTSSSRGSSPPLSWKQVSCSVLALLDPHTHARTLRPRRSIDTP